MSLTDAEKNRLKKVGLTGLNKPKRTPSHPKKKGVVAVRDKGKVKIIRFGDQKMGHNYSACAISRQDMPRNKERKTSLRLLANKVFWAGKRRQQKSPKSQNKSLQKVMAISRAQMGKEIKTSPAKKRKKRKKRKK